MKIKNLFIAALLLVCSVANAQQMMPQLSVDPDVRIGKLDNGLTYYIRHNNWPENRANFYIAQKVGSIQEEESQRGLAHFLEHMAFNGSDNFKGNGLIEYCRSIGVEFGGDLNAYTSIEETVYNIDNVPTTRESVIDSCLLVLRDWADGLLLEPEEIDKERGVIHEEWRLRTSAQSRMLERNLEKLYPGSKYGKRYPIGLMSVIDNFKYQELRDYYEKWYHPTNQGIIVVGNVDVDHIEAKIKELFGPITNPENAAPIVQEEVPDNNTAIVIVDKDKEQAQSLITVWMKHSGLPKEVKQTMAFPVYNYVKGAAMNMLNSRLTEVAQKADCPFVAAQVSDGMYALSKSKDALDISALPKDQSLVAEAMKAAVIEARRAAQFGFTATEYSRFQEKYMSSLDKMYSNKDKRTSSQLYGEIKAHFLDGEPLQGIDDEYNMMKQIVPNIPVAAVNELMAELVAKSDTNVVILNFNVEADDAVYPTEESLLNALHEANSAEIEAFVDNVKNEPLMSVMPKAGKIKKEKKSDKFDFTELELSNGVKVVLKKTDYKKDQVSLSGHGGAGATTYVHGDVNTKLFDNVIGVSGLGGFSSTELQKVLAGKIANADLSMGERSMSIGGSSTPKDVETMLQMVYLYFTNITKDEAAYANLLSQIDLQLKNREKNPDVAFSDSLAATLYPGDASRRSLMPEDVKNLSYDRVLQMAKERTASAKGWEFTIIGNYDEATIRPLICQYLGALPAKKLDKESPRKTFMVKGMVDNIFKRKQQTPKATAVMVWTNPDLAYTQERAIQLNMVDQILSMEYLKKIREEESAAYSCGAASGAEIARDGFHNFVLQAYCPMKPEKKNVCLQIMNDEVQNATENIDAEKLAKVKELMLKQLADSRNTNGYWARVISMYRNFGIDTDVDHKAIIERQTPETLKAFMKDFLSANCQVTVAMLPEE